MDWEDIRYFLALARSGSLSAASRELGVTHVTVGRRITRLEKAHGVNLFHRRQHGYQLTTAGERLRSEAEAVEDRCLYFERQMIGLSDVPTGTLAVSVPESSLVDSSRVLADFMQQHPQIQLRVIATSTRLDLGKLEADVALRLTNAPPESWVGRKLIDVPFYVYATEERLAQLTGDVADGPWAVWEPDKPEPEADAYQEGLIAKESIVLRTNSNSQLLGTIRSGAALGIVAEPIAQQYPELRRAKAAPALTLGLWLLTHSELKNAARVKCFMDFFRDNGWP